jgi:uncharacterized membrane protein YkvA (DUF1232 family)
MNDHEEKSVNDNTKLAQNKESLTFFSELWEKIRLVYRLFLDPEVPIYLKALPFIGVVYLLIPFDFLPDVIPGLGQLDDLTILIIGAKMFIDMAPRQAVERHIESMRSQRDRLSADNDEEEYLQEDPDIIEGIIINEEAGSGKNESA